MAYLSLLEQALARIVIVDDLQDMRDLVRIRLERSGHQIVGEASTGVEAIAVAAEHVPDLVVLDVMMPEMTGVEALPEIVRRCPDTKVLVFSSQPELTLADVRRLGGHGLLAKLDQYRLVTAVEELLAAGPDGDRP